MQNGPKRLKHKKIKKGKLLQYKYKTTCLSFGILGLKAVESGMVNVKQIEAARQAISRKTRRKTKIWIKVFPDIPITKKSTGIRMGKGKGTFSHWSARVRGGTVIFEVCGINVAGIIEALKTGGAKLPIKTKIFN